MQTNDDALQQQDLFKAFHIDLEQKLTEISTLWQDTKAIIIRLPHAEAIQFLENSASLTNLQHLFHNLNGSAGVLGYSDISSAARNLETRLRHPNWDNFDTFIRDIDKWLMCLNKAAKYEKPSPIMLASQMTAPGETVRALRSTKVIFLVEDDPIQAHELSIQLTYYGYNVRTFYNLGDIEPALDEELPAAIVMDIVFPEGDNAGIDVIINLFGHHDAAKLGNVPVVFITTIDEATKRLHAVRAGGSGYFTKPVDIFALVELLDHLTVQELTEPYRVLIVEDSSIQANYLTTVLSKAGMLTEVITDGFDILQALKTNNPDLILLDICLPYYTGIEIVRMIRQIPLYTSIPIIILSAEDDLDTQIQALSLGVDDFIQKPPNLKRLIQTVSSRIERYRTLRKLMVHDSLTGLLNHTAFRERFNQEMMRAKRQNAPLAFAMLDIDHFKKVNDSYGHSTGNRVLKSIAKYLKQQSRSSDIIGRYGGEEFAILMPDTPVKSAVQVLEELRLGFANIEHRVSTGDDHIHITFSCGMAGFPQYSDATVLSEAADQALYRAKQEGRNRTILADHHKMTPQNNFS